MTDGEHHQEPRDPPYERMYQRAAEVFAGTDQERVLIKVRRAIRSNDEPKVRALLAKAYYDLTEAYVEAHQATLEKKVREVPRSSRAEVISNALLDARTYIGKFEQAKGDIFGPPDLEPSPFQDGVERFFGEKLKWARINWLQPPKEDPTDEAGDGAAPDSGEDPTGDDVMAALEAEEIELAVAARKEVIGVILEGLALIDSRDLTSPDLKAMKHTVTGRRFDRLLDPIVRRCLTLASRFQQVRIPPESTGDLVQQAFVAEAHHLTDLTAEARHKFTSRNKSEPRHAFMVALVFGLSRARPTPETPAADAHWNLTEMLIDLQADYAVRLTERLAGHITQSTHIKAERFAAAIDGVDELIDRFVQEADRGSQIAIGTRARQVIHAPGTENPSAFERATALAGTDHKLAAQAQELLDLDDRLAWMIRQAGGSTEADDLPGPMNDDLEGGDPA